MGNNGRLYLHRPNDGGTIWAISGENSFGSVSGSTVFGGYISINGTNLTNALGVNGNASIGGYTAAPTNGLYVAGETVHASGISTPIISKNANYTLTSTDDTIKVTASGVTMTLPTSVGRTGREFTIINASNGDITVATTSSQLIGNYTTATTLTILSNNSYTLKSDGVGWVIKSKF